MMMRAGISQSLTMREETPTITQQGPPIDDGPQRMADLATRPVNAGSARFSFGAMIVRTGSAISPVAVNLDTEDDDLTQAAIREMSRSGSVILRVASAMTPFPLRTNHVTKSNRPEIREVWAGGNSDLWVISRTRATLV